MKCGCLGSMVPPRKALTTISLQQCIDTAAGYGGWLYLPTHQSPRPPGWGRGHSARGLWNNIAGGITCSRRTALTALTALVAGGISCSRRTALTALVAGGISCSRRTALTALVAGGIICSRRTALTALTALTASHSLVGCTTVDIGHFVY
jgi:hypothetical protein